MITQTACDPTFFTVRSESSDDFIYDVNASILMCTCIAGSGGKFCKHLAAVEHFFPDQVHVNRLLSPEQRYDLARIAVEQSELPPATFFGCSSREHDVQRSPLSMSSTINANTDHANSDDDFVTDSRSCKTLTYSDGGSGDVSSQTTVDSIEATVKEFRELLERFPRDTNVSLGMAAMRKTMRKFTNANGIASALHLFGKESVGAAGGRSKKISVQPTAISRRSEGKPRGCSALSKGAPRKRKNEEANIAGNAKKRPRNLILNVQLNRPNAKSHGSSH
jgi:hypothetical protein